MSESVPRGNRPAEELRDALRSDLGVDGEAYDELLVAALRAERLAGRDDMIGPMLDHFLPFIERPFAGRDAQERIDARMRTSYALHALAKTLPAAQGSRSPAMPDRAADRAVGGASFFDEVGVAGLTEEAGS